MYVNDRQNGNNGCVGGYFARHFMRGSMSSVIALVIMEAIKSRIIGIMLLFKRYFRWAIILPYTD